MARKRNLSATSAEFRRTDKSRKLEPREQGNHKQRGFEGGNARVSSGEDSDSESDGVGDGSNDEDDGEVDSNEEGDDSGEGDSSEDDDSEDDDSEDGESEDGESEDGESEDSDSEEDTDEEEEEDDCDETYCGCGHLEQVDGRSHTFCRYHRHMVQKVSETRSLLLREAEKAGAEAPSLALELPVEQSALDDLDKGCYRVYLAAADDDDSFKPDREEEAHLVNYVNFVWAPRSSRTKDRVRCALRSCSSEDWLMDVLPAEFPRPRVASTEPVTVGDGVRVVFLGRDHVEVKLRKDKAWISCSPPPTAPDELSFVGIHQWRPIPPPSRPARESSPKENWFNFNHPAGAYYDF